MTDFVRIAEKAWSSIDAYDDDANAAQQIIAESAAAVVASLSPRWWGTQDAGRNFESTFLPGQIHETLGSSGVAAKCLQQIIDLGTKSRTAVDKSLDSDEQQATGFGQNQTD